MPRLPDDNEPPRPTVKSKRDRRTSAPRRINAKTAPSPSENHEAVEALFRLTPIQFLALIIKVVLEDQVTDQEVGRICNTYYDALMNWGIWKD